MYEPLYVLITASHKNHPLCERQLHYGNFETNNNILIRSISQILAVHCIKSLLTPRFDAYKREQLLQLSIINGTYQPRSRAKKNPKEVANVNVKKEPMLDVLDEISALRISA